MLTSTNRFHCDNGIKKKIEKNLADFFWIYLYLNNQVKLKLKSLLWQIIVTLISSVFRIKIRKGWFCGKLITKEVLEIRNPWGRTVWKGDDVTAELTERKKKSLDISSDINGGFYVLKEDFVKVSYRIFTVFPRIVSAETILFWGWNM